MLMDLVNSSIAISQLTDDDFPIFKPVREISVIECSQEMENSIIEFSTTPGEFVTHVYLSSLEFLRSKFQGLMVPGDVCIYAVGSQNLISMFG